LSIWDVTQYNWSVVHGVFNVYVGASSRGIFSIPFIRILSKSKAMEKQQFSFGADIRLQGSFTN
jgi:hypothetical protein